MTITSFSDSKVQYETTLTSCTCPDYIYRRQKLGQFCKHMQVLEQEMNEATEQAETFLSLKAQYDVREQSLYSEVCGHLVRSNIHRHCGCMA